VRALAPFLAVAALCALPWIGVEVFGLRTVFGVILPGAALAAFLVGLCTRLIVWLRAPVPFPVSVTCGQQRSLPWIRPARFDNPHTRVEVVLRVVLEALMMRSLLRDARTGVASPSRLSIVPSWLLWGAAMSLHLSLAVIVLRHARLFLSPTPAWVASLGDLDGWFAVSMPPVHVTTVLLLGALGVLLVRRFASATVRYLTGPADLFALGLLLAIGGTGAVMRHVVGVDVAGTKLLLWGLWHGRLASLPASPLLYVHLFLVSVLAAYFPWSKLMHSAAALVSPTHSGANDSRARRHLNPWNAPVRVKTYDEYLAEYRDRMVEAGIDVDEGPA
jgi:nitrate reductase gamma subunit